MLLATNRTDHTDTGTENIQDLALGTLTRAPNRTGHTATDTDKTKGTLALAPNRTGHTV